jgi:hypothetical protein
MGYRKLFLASPEQPFLLSNPAGLMMYFSVTLSFASPTVRVSLRPAVYRQSVRLDAKPLEAYD